jgi:hypothetical protein
MVLPKPPKITVLLTVVLVASFAGTMISVPQMIVPVKAQAPPQCPHSPYDDFKKGSNGGLGAICEDDKPTVTCQDIAGHTGTASDTTCIATCTSTCDIVAFNQQCSAAGGTIGGPISSRTCTYPATLTCPPASGSTQTGQVNPQTGNCYIFPGNG